MKLSIDPNYHEKPLKDLSSGGFTSVLFKPSEIGDINITYDGPHLTNKLKREALKKNQPDNFKISKLITYFKDPDKDPDLYVRIKYSSVEWDLALLPEKTRPQIAYLEWDDGWSEDWVEIPDEIVNAEAPGDDNSYGTLTIKISGIPDPLIGGC